MSLNDKYIINGSTLSAIGDALREIGIPPKKIQGEINIYYKNYTSPWCRDTSYESFTASDFGLTSQTPVKVRMEITSRTGPDVYISDAGGLKGVSASVGKILYVTLPVHMRGDSSYKSSQFTAKIYPLDGNGNYIIPTSEDDTSEYSTEVTTGMIPNPNRQILVQDIPTLISVPIDYEGLSYGYLGLDGTSFYSYNEKTQFLTFIPLNTRQKIGFCIGETVSDRLRAGFFSEKTYNNFSQYVENPSSSPNSVIYSGGISVTGSTKLSGDGLLKRFYYTAPSDGMLVVSTSSNGTPAHLHVWRA